MRQCGKGFRQHLDLVAGPVGVLHFKLQIAFSKPGNLSRHAVQGLDDSLAGKQGAALLNSYAYTLEDKPARRGDTAVQTVQFRYLDMNALEKDLMTPITTITPAEGEPRPVYAELRELLEKPQKYYTTAELQLTLRYSEGQWRVVADEDLLSVLAGGK